MINPAHITDYNLSQWKLEEVLLFWVCAAGKNATTAARGLQGVLTEGHDTFGKPGQPGWRPFDVVRFFGRRKLPWALKRNGIGCYRHKARTMWELANSGFNLKTCTVEDLERIYGIGMKTSRCFMIHSRKDAEYAALDTHILKYMADQGYDAPKSTPGRKKYLEIEKQFLALAKRSGKTVSEFDLDLWNEYKVPS